MFIKNYQVIFFSTIVIGTIMAISSNSWITAWIGLEINLIRIIPLFLAHSNRKSTEAAIKYFIVQAFASIFLIFFSSLRLSSSLIFFAQNLTRVVLISLIIKSGIAPFHFWFPQVIYISSWFMGFMILVWQKIAPFVLISYFNDKILVTLAIFMSAIVGGLGGLITLNIKLIITYSSIIHSRWILILTSIDLILWVNYFFIYSTLSAVVILISYKLSLNIIKDIYSSPQNLSIKIIFSINFLSLGGLPPFLGFYAKASAIIISINYFSAWLLLSLIFLSLVSLFYYIKIMYNFSINNVAQINIFLNKKIINRSLFSLNSLILISLAGNIFIPFLVLLN